MVIYIQCVALQCLSFFFLFKLLSKQKNHNLEISVLGQLCPAHLLPAPSKDPRTLSEITWCKVRLMPSELYFLSLLEEFCMYKGWKSHWVDLLVQENGIKIVIRLTGYFLLRPYEWDFCFWNLTSHDGGCKRVCVCMCKCLCVCLWVCERCIPLPWFCRHFSWRKGQSQEWMRLGGKKEREARGTF